ncbi:dedicator of cytokinesis [Anaeramoeba ignava]|uniref:Dedicator of cytokinesis n=1 Tax=Anaeramoeba ignava TaxID=1746090 RepID=A0A9Q0L804_ANAIG|nr:dedicator of cytokinesis [Anaeramoeba ignava]
MGDWRKYEKYGVSLYHFVPESLNQLPLQIGDYVEIKEQCLGWFRGKCINSGRVGLFPVNFIEVIEEEIDSIVEVMKSEFHFYLKVDPIILEIESVVQEWRLIMFHLFKEKKIEEVNAIIPQIKNLLGLRKTMLKPHLSKENLIALKNEVIKTIEEENKYLKIPNTLRTPKGWIAKDDNTNFLDYYQLYKKAQEKKQKEQEKQKEEIQDEDLDEIPKEISKEEQELSYSLFLEFKSVLIQIKEPLILLFSLYNTEKEVFITEEYPLYLDENHKPITDPDSPKFVEFQDIMHQDIDNHQLICKIFRIGDMVFKEKKIKRKFEEKTPKYQRPVGLSSLQFSSNLLTGYKNRTQELVMKIFVPQQEVFFPIMNELISEEDPRVFHDNEYLTIKLTLQPKKELDLFPDRNISTQTRNMKLPQLVLPSQFFNDLFLTIKSGAFHTSKTKNIKIEMEIRNEKGDVIPNGIFAGDQLKPTSKWESVIYYHRLDPIYNSFIRINLPLHLLREAHLFFTLLSCPNEPKKPEKIFGYCYKYIYENGVILNQNDENLTVYKHQAKLDPKIYLKQTISANSKTKISPTKDTLNVNYNLCSTIIPQIPELISFLNWRQLINMNDLKSFSNIMNNITSVNLNEILPFIGIIFDNLFEIVSEYGEKIQKTIFDGFIEIITSIESQLQSFKIILKDYINDRFFIQQDENKKKYLSKIYTWFIQQLLGYIENYDNEETGVQMRKAIKEMGYLFELIINSRMLEIKIDPKAVQDMKFDQDMIQLLETINRLFQRLKPEWINGAQVLILKKLYPITVELTKVFDITMIIAFMDSIFQSISEGRKELDAEKMNFLIEFSNGVFMDSAKSQCVILPLLLKRVEENILASEENIAKSTTILRNILVKIQNLSEQQIDAQNQETNQMPNEIMIGFLEKEEILKIQLTGLAQFPSLLMLAFRENNSFLNEISQAKEMGEEQKLQEIDLIKEKNDLKEEIVSILLSMFHFLEFSSLDYLLGAIAETYSRRSPKSSLFELFEFLTESRKNKIYPKDAQEIQLFHYSIILKIIRRSINILLAQTDENYQKDLWLKFFLLCVNFINANDLQIELLPNYTTQLNILDSKGDMRQEAANIVRRMWKICGDNRLDLMPDLIDPFLSLILLDNSRLQRIGLELYYETIVFEFSKTGDFATVEQNTLGIVDKAMKKGNYNKFEKIFFPYMIDKFQNNFELEKKGKFFLDQLKEIIAQIFLLRKYQDLQGLEDEKSEAIIRLIEFLRKKKQYFMIPRYIRMLYNLNQQFNNSIESGNTLLLYSELLSWSSKKIEPKEFGFPREISTERKQKIIKLAVDCLNQGKSWETAIKYNRELSSYFEFTKFDYFNLQQSLRKELELFRNLINDSRVYPSYFRVGYYGKGFDDDKYIDLKDSEFVYKGELLERVSEFIEKIKLKYPGSIIGTDDPSQEQREGEGMYIQVAALTPSSMDELFKTGKNTNINVFLYSKPFRKDKSLKNEFKDLWLRNEYLILEEPFPNVRRRLRSVEKKIKILTPIQNAVNTTENKNIELINKISYYKTHQNENFNPLTMSLNGVIDAAVNGGVLKYQQAFFVDEYLLESPNDEHLVVRLKLALKKQQEVVEEGLKLHNVLVSDEFRPLHSKLTKMFRELKRQLAPSLTSLNLIDF